jgi:glyoxylase-like metal-dependent hydrolase (beta-lactamase superfamily II)
MRTVIIAVLLLAGGMAGVGPSPVAAQAPAIDLGPFAAREITPDVHMLAVPHNYYGAAISNVVLIEQSDGLVVIDSGLAAGHGRAIVNYARMLTAKPIKAVAITHWHNDHPLGVSAIRDAFPNVRIIATPGTETGLLGAAATLVGFRPDPQLDQELYKQADQAEEQLRKLLEDSATTSDRRERVKKALADFKQLRADYRGTYIVPPTETFDRELLLDDPKVPVRLLHFGRANTDGDLVAWLPEQKIVASGDIVVAPSPYGFYSFPGDWIATIDKLKGLGFRTLIPGHGEPQWDTSYLDKLAVAIADVRAQVGPLAKQGMTLEEVRKKVDFTKSIALFGDTPKIQANTQGLFFDPMIPNAYKEARGEPIIQGEGNPKSEHAHTPPKPSSKKHKS